MAKFGLIPCTVDKNGVAVRKGDRVAFYKPRWLGIFGRVRAEGTVNGILQFYEEVLIYEDSAPPGSMCWGRQGKDIERLDAAERMNAGNQTG